MRKALTCFVTLASILILLGVTCTPTRAATYTMVLPLGTTGAYTEAANTQHVAGQSFVLLWTNATALKTAFTVAYDNGTAPVTKTFLWDVRYGPGNNITLAGQWFMVVAANLNVGDSCTEYGKSWTINSSTTMVVAGSSRTVNLVQLAQVVFMYWDRPTGLLVKMNMYAGPTYGWFNTTLTATTAFTTITTPPIPGYPFEAIGIALAVGVVAGVLYHRKHPKRTSPS